MLVRKGSSVFSNAQDLWYINESRTQTFFMMLGKAIIIGDGRI